MKGNLFLKPLLSMGIVALLLAVNWVATASSQVNSDVYLPILLKPLPAQNADNCKPAAASQYEMVRTGWPRQPDRMPTVGTVKAAVIFVDFSDAVSTKTPQEIYSFVSPGAADIFSTMSYNQMNYVLEPHFVMLRMSQPGSTYNTTTADGQFNYMEEAMNLADAAVDFSDADQIVVLNDPDTSPFFNGPAFVSAPFWDGLEADGNTIYSGTTSGRDLSGWGAAWLNHETGHNMGLPDIYSYNDSGFATHRFVGGFSSMGLISGNAPDLFAYEKWFLGWLRDDQIFCHETSEISITLTPVETADGLKAVMVPTGPSTLIVVESRRNLGLDINMAEGGVVVYKIDASIETGNGTIEVFPKDAPPFYNSAPLGMGETITVDGVTIEVVGVSAESDTIKVTK